MALGPGDFSYIVELDLDQDGLYETDISQWAEEVQATTGRDRASQLAGRAAPGKLRVLVNNDDSRFSDFNTSSPYFDQLLPGKGIRFRDADALLYDPEAVVIDSFDRPTVTGYNDLGTADLGGTWVGTAPGHGNHYVWGQESDRSVARMMPGEYTPSGVPVASKTNLISYWSLQEQSGSRLDNGPSFNHLTEWLAPVDYTQGPGMAYPKSAHFTGTPATGGYLRDEDNASLSMGDIAFTVCAWVRISDKTAGRCVLSKWLGGSNYEYLLYYEPGTDRFRWVVTSNGTTGTQTLVDATNGLSPQQGRWVFVEAYHDPTANQIGIRVNNRTVNTAAHSTGVFSGAAPFTIGTDGDLVLPWRGDIAGVSLWKRLLTSAERAAMFRDGPYLATLDATNPLNGGTDVYVQATVHPGSPPQPWSNFPTQVGVLFQYFSTAYYDYVVYDSGKQQIQLVQRQGDNDITLAAYAVEQYDGMTIGVLTTGNLFTVYLEGVPIIRQTVATLVGGANDAGLYGKVGEGSLRPYISDFRVYSHLPEHQGRGPDVCENGDFETNTTGWAAFGTGTLLTRQTTWASKGAASMRVAFGSASDFGARYNRSLTGATQTRRYEVTLRLRVAAGNGAIGGNTYITLFETGGAVAERSTSGVPVTVAAGEVTLRHHIEILANDRTSLGVQVRVTGGAAGDQFFVDDVQVRAEQATSEGVYWTGTLDTVMPDASGGTVHRATIDASGPLAGLARQQTAPPVADTGKRTGLLIGQVLGDAGYLNPPGPIAEGDVMTGTFMVAPGSALAHIRAVEETELGFVFESQEGQVGFRERSYRDALVSPLATFSDDPFDAYFHYASIEQQSWIGDVYNRVDAGVSPYSLGVQGTLWASDPSNYVLQSNERLTLVATYEEGTKQVARWTGHFRTIEKATPAIHANVPTTNFLATAGTTHPVTMVTPINPSDLLFIAYWQVPLEDCDVRTPSGWTQLIPYDKILGFALFAKKAVGDEDSTVVNIITDGPTTSMAAAWRVVSWEGQWGLVDLEDCVKVTGANQGMSSYPDPPPIWWGDWPAVPTLVYGFGLAELDTNSLPPSNMGEAFDQAINGTQDVSLAIGYTTTGAVDSFDPNVFGMNAEAYWQAFTLAVRGTSAGTWVMGFPEPQGDDGRFIIAYQEHIGSTYQVHTHLEATGIPIIKGDDVTTRVEDLDSQLKYGVLSWENTANLFRSPSDAEAYGQYILDRYAERHPILSLTYVASQDELYYGQAKARRVGDRIAIIADNGSGLGIAQDFFIEAISHRVVRGRHEVGYELSPAG